MSSIEQIRIEMEKMIVKRMLQHHRTTNTELQCSICRTTSTLHKIENGFNSVIVCDACIAMIDCPEYPSPSETKPSDDKSS